MQQKRVLIIGAGKQGALNDAPGTENENKVISFAKAFKEKEAELNFTDVSYDAAARAKYIWGGSATISGHCEPWDMDIIAITTPDNNHYQELKNVIPYSPKLVICEKPLCETAAQAREIVELYKKAKIPLMVNYTKSYIPCLRNLTTEHGKAISGYALFNRGWMHSASHIITFFNMLKLSNYKIRELKELDFRVWIISVTFEDGFIWTEERLTDAMPVPDIYDFNTRYLVQNAYNFLDEKEEIFCTGEDALKSILDIELFKNLLGS